VAEAIPEGVIVFALVWGPLIRLHGYRAWWLVVFYVVVAAATIGGIVSYYRTPPSTPHSS
jgi:hypothetical protein